MWPPPYLRYAPCSVEVVRAREHKQDGTASMRVLPATDGSACSELAARSIAERPWPADTEVRVLNAVQLILSNARAFLELPFGDSEEMELSRAPGDETVARRHRRRWAHPVQRGVDDIGVFQSSDPSDSGDSRSSWSMECRPDHARLSRAPRSRPLPPPGRRLPGGGSSLPVFR